jgi:hypothetical protein
MHRISERGGITLEIKYYALIIIAITWGILYFGYAGLGTNDDLLVWNLLKAGHSGTLLFNYATSFFLVQAYHYFPAVEWYSIVLSSIVVLNSLLLLAWVANEKSFGTRVVLFATLVAIIVYFLTYICVTNVTVLTLATSIVYLRKNVGVAVALILIALLLRTHVAISLLPLLLFAFMSIPFKEKINKSSILYVLPLVTLLGLGYVWQLGDNEYLEWLKVYKPMLTVLGYTVSMREVNPLLSTDYVLLMSPPFWVQDKELLPLSSILAIVPSQLEIVLQSIVNMPVQEFLQRKFLLFGVLVSLPLFFRLRWWQFVGLMLFTLSILVILAIRDVPRVSLPLLLMWFFLLYYLYEGYKLKFLMVIFAVYVGLFFANQAYSEIKLTIEDKNKDRYTELNRKKQELYQVIRESGTVSEYSIHVPLRRISDLVKSNKLFDEENWLVMQDKLLMAGWLARHPYFYESHQISSYGIKRKYRNYYEFLISEDTSFIGLPTETIDTKAVQTVLNAYDERYLSNKNTCHHEFVVTEKKEFWIAKMEVICVE